MSGFGFVLSAATLGFGSLLLKPQRGVFSNKQGGSSPLLLPQAVLEESHRDSLVITDHPVEGGSVSSDHAYKLPMECEIVWSWSDSPSPTPGLASSLGAQAASLAGTLGGSAVGNIITDATTGASSIANFTSALSGNATTQSDAIYQQLLGFQNSRTLLTIYTGKRHYNNMLIKEIAVRTDQDTENIIEAKISLREIIIASVSTVTFATPINPNPTKTADPSKQPPTNQGTVQATQVTQ